MSTAKLQHVEGWRGTSERRPYNKVQGATIGANIIRNQLTTKTWMALGAAVQLALFALPVKRYYAATPVVAYLMIEIIGTFMIMAGLRADPQKEGMVETKYTALIPDEQGNFRSGSQGEKISVFHLAFRSHHHLGMFSPGFQEMAKYANAMFNELEAKADEYNLHGLSTYNNVSASQKASEILIIMHFKSNEDVMRYSKSSLHRKGWEWYTKIVKQHPHLGIMHELYEVPAGSWENIYVNIAPSLMATSRHKIVDEEGNDKWISPLVEASRGKISSTAGRLA